jgi:deoxyribodipyrimidine photo-lyase
VTSIENLTALATHGLAPTGVPTVRVRALNPAPIRAEGSFVLYWMTAFRRLEWNYALDHSLAWARNLKLPLLIFEPLRAGAEWSSVRHHRFCLDGMLDHEARLEGHRVGYFSYIERVPGDGKGLLAALGAKASLIVTDDAPVFFLPRMRAKAARTLDVRLEAVDSNGILPLAEAGRDFTTAFSFRRHLQKRLPTWLEDAPDPTPLAGVDLPSFGDPGQTMSRRLLETLGDSLMRQWPSGVPAESRQDMDLKWLPSLDRSVPRVSFSGGRPEGVRRLSRFLRGGLEGYAEARNHPDRTHFTGLSPWFHWGHISSHEVLSAVLDAEGWTARSLAGAAGTRKVDGRREGWWGLGADSEAFLDQLLTWRELGFHTAWRSAATGDDPEAWDTLPSWARVTLDEHRLDPRPMIYELEAFERAETHDPLWNAAQRELRSEGTIHNYLRMLWGKKILEWSESPEEALRTMIHLNHKWALDGRDPNSTSGIMWVLGRYDRGWPERAIYGKIRSMSSDSTRRKVELKRYLARFGSSSSRS